eukprot:scaffold86865_cov67-Attheya_sp.AAC.1
MPGYVKACIHKYQHPDPKRQQHAPHEWEHINYGAKQQMTKPHDDSPLLDTVGLKRMQGIVGTLLYYARALDSTMLMAIGSISSAQANSTEATAKAVAHLLDYCATHSEATIKYTASDMILRIHSDGTQPINGAIHILCHILRNGMSSAAEAECGALFLTAKEGQVDRTTLVEMGHPQPATPIQIDNTTTLGIVHSNFRQRRSKAMDMRFYWVQDRVRQGHFNLADYFTKHHPPSHHRQMHSTYLHSRANYLSSVMRGCVNPVPEFPAQTAVTRIRPMHNGTQSHPEVRTHKPASLAELVAPSRES